MSLESECNLIRNSAHSVWLQYIIAFGLACGFDMIDALVQYIYIYMIWSIIWFSVWNIHVLFTSGLFYSASSCEQSLVDKIQSQPNLQHENLTTFEPVSLAQFAVYYLTLLRFARLEFLCTCNCVYNQFHEVFGAELKLSMNGETPPPSCFHVPHWT